MAGITALIKPDSVFIFDYGTSSSSAIAQEVHSFLMHELHGRLESKDSAFYELRALEAVLTGIIHSLTLRQSLLIPKIQVALKALSLDVDQETLKSLHLFKNDLTQFESKVSTIGDILRKLLLK